MDSSAGVLNFNQVISGDYGHIVSSDEGYSIWMVYPGFAIYYPNINSSTSNARWNFNMTGHYWMPPLMEDPIDPEKVYLAGGSTTSGSKLFHLSYDNGVITATEESFDFSVNGSKLSALAYSPLNPRVRYAITNKGEFYFSDDGGQNWVLQSKLSGFGAHYFYGAFILASPNDTSRLYVCGSGYSNPGVYMSDDYGKTFTALEQNIPNTLFYQLATDPEEKYLFAATEAGAFVYIFQENKWFDLTNQAAPDQIYWAVDYIPSINTVRFGTYGRGIWDFVICDTSARVTADFNVSIEGLKVQITNHSFNADSFLFDFGDGMKDSSMNPTHTYSSKGEYTIQLIAFNSCYSDTQSKKVNVYPLSMEEPSDLQINIYPVPFGNQLIIQTQENILMEVYNSHGKLVYQKKVQRGAGKIATGNWAGGVYYVRIYSRHGQVQTRKLIKYKIQ